jgi:hypothetical protein
MTNLKTKESTLDALAKAASQSPTKEEIEKQRVSFIMGSLNAESPITREKVVKILADQQRGGSKP